MRFIAVITTGSVAQRPRISIGNESTHWRMGTLGNTRSVICAASLHMRREAQLGHVVLCLHEKATITWWLQASHSHRAIPNYVKQALSQYLKCGDFNYGFALCECDACNHQVMVAFSCKQRTTCPSCASRRMCSEAAHITDRVLPNVPIRQWVLSLPMELRGLCATDPRRDDRDESHLHRGG